MKTLPRANCLWSKNYSQAQKQHDLLTPTVLRIENQPASSEARALIRIKQSRQAKKNLQGKFFLRID